MTDTSPDTAIRYRRMIMSLTPAERLTMASGMFDSARLLALAGIREALGKNATEQQLRVELFLRFYGADYAPDQRQRIVSELLKP